MRVAVVSAVLFAICLCGDIRLSAQTAPKDAVASPSRLPPAARDPRRARESDVRIRANENVVYLMGGALGATYILMAHDMAVVVNGTEALRVIPAVGGAAVQNIRDILLLRGVDLGIASLQSLRALEASGEAGTSDLVSKVAYIAVLSADDMQVLARPEIKALKDLAGKTVAFNTKGSSTALLAPQIFKTLKIDVTPVFMPQGDAIEKMRTGEVAATVCMCPRPTPAFAAVKGDMGFSFVEVEYGGELEKDYLPGTITAEDYPQLMRPGARIQTVATQSLLLTYNWSPEHWRYKRIEKFVDILFSNFGELQKPPRHSLWKSVNLAASVKGMQRFPAAQQWLDRHARR